MGMITAVLMVSLIAAAPAPKGISGTWDVKLKADWSAALPDLVCTLTQKGQALTGTCRPAADAQSKGVGIAGKVRGNKVDCAWNVPTPDGATWAFTLTGTTDPTRSRISGVFRMANAAGAASSGKFVATRQQARASGL